MQPLAPPAPSAAAGRSLLTALVVVVVSRRAVKLGIGRLDVGGVEEGHRQVRHIMPPLISLKIQPLRPCTVAYFVLACLLSQEIMPFGMVFISPPSVLHTQHRNDLAGLALSPSALCPLPQSIPTAVIH